MGWGAIFLYFEIAKQITHRPLQPILASGVLYSVGAFLNLLEWPILWPGVFQSHELFHFFVMAGSLAHFQFMLKVVLPAPTVQVSPTLSPLPTPAVGRPVLQFQRFRAIGYAIMPSRRV
jgi:hypothetical protein